MDDIKISRSVNILPIKNVAQKYKITEDDIELYGKFKAKFSLEYIRKAEIKKDGHLILVTATNPTPAGEGKTTVSIGLAQALEKLGKKTVLALREPSLGPCFGIKGGAAGGGYSQLIPMDELNLHFTGDFHAITYANNLLASAIDNHIYHGNKLRIDTRRILWKRCIDLNDRALRKIVVGIGGISNGYLREDGFNITAASEIMAILCLSIDMYDLKRRLENIVVAYDVDSQKILAKDLNVVGAMQALLKDAIKPNIIQTTDNTLAIVHGGPFANIAHGCNSVIATRMAMKLGDYAITEAGFGADLGGEKFLDIKCRLEKLKPSIVIIVTTVKSIKYNGNMAKNDLQNKSVKHVKEGICNLKRHIENIRLLGYKPIIVLNKFATDTKEEIEYIKSMIDEDIFECTSYQDGANGAIELAKYIENIEKTPIEPNYIYKLEDDVVDKIQKVCNKIYRANEVKISTKAMSVIKKIREDISSKFPICIAKTQYSFTDNAKKLGAPDDFSMNVTDIYVNYGAEMIVVLMGDILTMPGLPKITAAENIYINDKCQIEGLS